jgi:N-acetylmuramoyl-L-alanine amidase
MTDIEIKTRLSELHAVALTLWGEARSEPIEGIVGVANVIRNRKEHDKWGWKIIVHKKAQFSCWASVGGEANHLRVMSMAVRLLAGEEIDDDDWQECLWVAEGLIAGRLRDNTRGSRHYMTLALFRTNPPAWVKGHKPVAEAGNHCFFNDVG